MASPTHSTVINNDHLSSSYAHDFYVPYSRLLNPVCLSALTLLGPLCYFIYQDYASFLNLGPGGTPSTFLGYLRITFLRLFALRNPHIPAPIPAVLRPQSGYMTPQRAAKLPKRAGVRPKVTGIAPHRQITQKGTLANFAELSQSVRALAAAHATRLALGTSCFEKHGTGLFSLNPVNRTCNGEICHAHPSDGSLHLTLHPADARVVLEKCWGERHPLARGGWCTRFVPSGFVMVYAPRDAEELKVVMEIIRAAVWWVSGWALEDEKNDVVAGSEEIVSWHDALEKSLDSVGACDICAS
ncbi:hypothetical protein GP486_004761 [Trichoglossum hirsutum]|uniref:Luciferase domain-containing protein n=1 Tax=Trichoglossum hirsutum TaxID=265104 RepID=A0A9P8LAJ5_9PEZI|nr:hypothetical protein GP486_004761 [Trichoglossum hirsutum]